MNESVCAGCNASYPDKLFDFKQLETIHTPLLCPKCYSASVHKPQRERVEFLEQQQTKN